MLVQLLLCNFSNLEFQNPSGIGDYILVSTDQLTLFLLLLHSSLITV
jgi:hypothetical protein